MCSGVCSGVCSGACVVVHVHVQWCVQNKQLAVATADDFCQLVSILQTMHCQFKLVHCNMQLPNVFRDPETSLVLPTPPTITHPPTLAIKILVVLLLLLLLMCAAKQHHISCT